MPIKTVDAKTLKTWLDSGEAMVIDVREASEYNAENIPGSKLVPLASISKKTLPEHKGKKLIVHCKGGKRGEAACEKLLKEDPNLEIYNLEGGISAWVEAGNPVKCSGKFFLPLDRQVQLTIGLCLLIGSILGYYVDTMFFLFSGFVGIGLTFAGLTGYCGLAMLMAKMPWNQNQKSTSQNFCMTNQSNEFK
jgi:rhodanese-related sulfurtransferase